VYLVCHDFQDVYQLVEQHVELVGDSSLGQVEQNLVCLVWH
jgi:lysyl-tRNA synthetase class II